MKSKLMLALASALAVVSLNVGVVAATEQYVPKQTLTGVGECQKDGSFKITWTIENKDDDDKLKVTKTSDENVVPKYTEVDEESSKSFVQTVDGTKAGSFALSLTIKVDHRYKELEYEVSLREACEQPVVATTPVVAAAATPQVAVPVKSVSAGAGGARTAKLGALLGLTGSLAILGLGVRRLAKSQ